MADRIIKVVTPASSYDLMTLAELKALFGIPTADTSQDAQLQGYITGYSDIIATICNRVFAYEEVRETWRCVNVDDCTPMTRLFLSHYPVVEDDIVSIESPSGTALVADTDYVVEERSGKIELMTGAIDPIVVHYSGGYAVPDDTPPALKAALELMIREAQALLQRLGAGGIRSLTHKEARVMFYDPLALLGKQKGLFGFAATAANALLMHYVRLEV
jgi:hypothetical protein